MSDEKTCMESLCSGIANMLTCGGCCGSDQQRTGPPAPLDERQRNDPASHLFGPQLPSAGWGSGPQGGFAKSDFIALLRTRPHEGEGRSSEELATVHMEVAADSAVSKCSKWLELDTHGSASSRARGAPLRRKKSRRMSRRYSVDDEVSAVQNAEMYDSTPASYAWKLGQTAPQRILGMLGGLPDWLAEWLARSVVAETLSSGLVPTDATMSSGRVSHASTPA